MRRIGPHSLRSEKVEDLSPSFVSERAKDRVRRPLLFLHG